MVCCTHYIAICRPTVFPGSVIQEDSDVLLLVFIQLYQPPQHTMINTRTRDELTDQHLLYLPHVLVCRHKITVVLILLVLDANEERLVHWHALLLVTYVPCTVRETRRGPAVRTRGGQCAFPPPGRRLLSPRLLD